jgi:hypothetical protein
VRRIAAGPARFVFFLLALGAANALAEVTVSSRAPAADAPSGDLFQARLRYGVSVRSGSEQDLGPGLSYSGVSPNDLAFSGWWWLLLGRHLGLTAAVQREGFALYDGDTKVTQGGLLRASAAPTGRIGFGPARIELAAGYAFAQLPVFGTVTTPSMTPVSRHSVLLAARGLVDLGPVTIEARFEYPITLAVSSPGTASTGLTAGGALRVNLFRTGALKWGLLAEAMYSMDSLTGPDLTASQSVLRAGGALDLQWEEEKVVVRTARVSVKVLAAGAPLAGTSVGLTVGGQRRELTTDAQGVAQGVEVEPGTIVASAEAPGFLPAEERVELAAGQDAALVLSLAKEPPKVGSLKVLVVSKIDGAPVPAAKIEWGGALRDSDDKGVLTLDGLKPGPVGVKVTAPGFNPGEEAASVVAGQTSELTVSLVPEKKRLPATMKGQIRNVRGGKPVAAKLEIKELKLQLTADDEGKFTTEIPGGKYTVRISAPNFIPQTKQVVVRDGDQAIFNVELFPK